MIINNVKPISTNDIPKYAWGRINQFQNVEHTTSIISFLHNLPPKQLPNARRQAEQIKYCLSQAKEYFDAARVVSLATRPVLLYYSIMSMALAEVLLKQTGSSRLSALREQHNCHGLQLAVSGPISVSAPLEESASQLVAKSQVDASGNPRGTFEVWRRSAREYPVGGYVTKHMTGGTQEGYETLLVPSNVPPPLLPKDGLTLLSCLVELPYMRDALASFNIQLQMVRATCKAEQKGLAGARKAITIIHPAPQHLLDRFGGLVVAHPAAINTVDIIELASGYIVNQKHDDSSERIYSWPHSTCMSDKEVYFSCSDTNLGEFGFLYVALHICGNVARYYPDLWLKHIEKSSPTALAVDEMCNHAFDRLPLLCLSELTRHYHVLTS